MCKHETSVYVGEIQVEIIMCSIFKYVYVSLLIMRKKYM